MEKLKLYQKKRDFNKTKEPLGEVKKSGKKLRFVVQHHLARRDHYDFRLELVGTLKSWAIPKGPSYNPNDKRLAVEVEDHPLAYRNFEGTIPQGAYGGGPVMIWDEGFWEPLGDAVQDLAKGTLKFTLFGERLKGNWALIRLPDTNWLLIKEKDRFSKKTVGITKFKTSIRSGRSMEQILNEK